MEPIKNSTNVIVKHCTLCQGETNYYCRSCQKDLCQHCKATHVIDLDTIHHEVVIYREKFKYLPKRDICMIHSDKIYNKYCEPCEIPVCDSCSEHKPKRSPLLAVFYPREDRKHKILGIRAAYKMKRQQHKEIIHHVRSQTLYNSRVQLKGLKSDVETCHREISRRQSEMIKRGQGLKDLMDRVLLDEINRYRCLIQKIRRCEYIARIQNYEQRHEQSNKRPVKFLRFIKNARLPWIQDTPHLTQHCRLSLTQEINMEDLIELLSELQITERGKRQAGNELLLTLLPSPVLQKSTTVKGVEYCYHISCVTSDRVWVSDSDHVDNNLILTDTTTGKTLYSVKDSLHSWDSLGIHTVNSECELIYIDTYWNINKLSSDMKTTTRFIKKPYYSWEPRCVYCSPSSRDLLVGMSRYDIETWTDIYIGEVRRYNNTGKLTQTIPHNNTHHKLYVRPIYITENNNGDIVVSEWRGSVCDDVVVTDRGGRYRFSYEGPPSGSGLKAYGICTDALSHILVCDFNTYTVQVINKDGVFLSSLLITESPGIHHDGPRSLSYDVNTHVLYVGLWNNTVSVVRYIDRHRDLTGVLDPILDRFGNLLQMPMPTAFLESVSA